MVKQSPGQGPEHPGTVSPPSLSPPGLYGRPPSLPSLVRTPLLRAGLRGPREVWAQGTSTGGCRTRAGFVQWAGGRTERPRAPWARSLPLPADSCGSLVLAALRRHAGGTALAWAPRPALPLPSPGEKLERREKCPTSEGCKSSLESIDRKDLSTSLLFTAAAQRKHWAHWLALPTEGAQCASIAGLWGARGCSLPSRHHRPAWLWPCGGRGPAYLSHLCGLHSLVRLPRGSVC